jgi:hypothetical protein
MKRIWILGVIAAALVIGWVVVPAEPACALPTCTPGGTTLPAWGMGSSCQASINNAVSLATAQIPSSCDVCGITPIEVTPCHVCGTDPNDPQTCIDANDYRADYKVRYRCAVDFGDPPM